MGKSLDYDIVTASEETMPRAAQVMAEKVTHRALTGWEPYGDLVCVIVPGNQGKSMVSMAQPVIRKA